jgi:predicted nucleic acid-binding protein
MKRVLFDVNVILDVLLDRSPHAEVSAAAWTAVEAGRAKGLVSAHAVTTLHYLIRKQQGAAKAKTILSAILRVFDVAAVDSAVVFEALQLSCPDFEDAVSAAAARRAQCDYVITRDPRGFLGSPVRPLTPDAAVPLLSVE